MAKEIHQLAELEPEESPAKGRFLLEMNMGDLTKLHLKTQAYWITAVIAARSAKRGNQQWDQERRKGIRDA